MFECLLPFNMVVTSTESQYRDAVNGLMIDVVNTGTQCHCSGPFQSAL